MKTLYGLLAIERNATQVDIERGYRRCLDSYLANRGTGQLDQETMRMQAIRDAYLLLSSPTRRKSYDQKLRESAEIRYARTASGGLPRASLMLAVALLIGSGSYLYKGQQGKVGQAHQAEIRTGKSGTQALADESSRREQENLERERREADLRRRQMEQARSDARPTPPPNQQIARAN